MSNKNHQNLQSLTVTSILAAIVVIVSFLPLKTLGLEITFSMVPVAIGAIIYGPYVGAILGGTFGIVSFLQCLGYSAFGSTLFGINPFFTAIVCIPTRVLAGYLTGLIYKGLSRIIKSDIPSLLVASVSAPLLNTTFFMGSLVALFYQTDFIQNIMNSYETTNPFIFIILFVGINGLVEIICGFIVAFPCAKAIHKFLKL